MCVIWSLVFITGGVQHVRRLFAGLHCRWGPACVSSGRWSSLQVGSIMCVVCSLVFIAGGVQHVGRLVAGLHYRWGPACVLSGRWSFCRRGPACVSFIRWSSLQVGSSMHVVCWLFSSGVCSQSNRCEVK